MTPDQLWAFKFYQSQGLQPHQAAGLVGRLSAESGATLNPTARGDGGLAYGLAQWHPDRWGRVSSWIQSQGLDPNSREAQAKGVLWEMQNGGENRAWQMLQGAKTPADAYHAMMAYERPAGYQPGNPMGGAGYDHGLKHAMGLMGADTSQVGASDPGASYTAASQTNTPRENSVTPMGEAAAPPPAGQSVPGQGQGQKQASLGDIGLALMKQAEAKKAQAQPQAQPSAYQPQLIRQPFRPLGLLGG